MHADGEEGCNKLTPTHMGLRVEDVNQKTENGKSSLIHNCKCAEAPTKSGL